MFISIAGFLILLLVIAAGAGIYSGFEINRGLAERINSNRRNIDNNDAFFKHFIVEANNVIRYKQIGDLTLSLDELDAKLVIYQHLVDLRDMVKNLGTPVTIQSLARGEYQLAELLNLRNDNATIIIDEVIIKSATKYCDIDGYDKNHYIDISELLDDYYNYYTTVRCTQVKKYTTIRIPRVKKNNT